MKAAQRRLRKAKGFRIISTLFNMLFLTGLLFGFVYFKIAFRNAIQRVDPLGRLHSSKENAASYYP